MLFSEFLGRFTGRLRQAYASGVGTAERQRLFQEGQEEFRRLALLTRLYSDFGTEHLNNAVILHYFMYADRLSEFDTLLQHENGDLRRTIEVVIAAVKKGGDPFAAVEGALRAKAAAREVDDAYPEESSAG